jgi:hypothetical protein
MKLTPKQISMIGQSIPSQNGDRIVLIEVSGRKDVSITELNANIYRINNAHDVIWQIDAPQPSFDRDPFVSIERKETTITADRFGGDELHIDENTGVAKLTGWHK